jgi:uncharacterized caspase-like protein
MLLKKTVTTCVLVTIAFVACFGTSTAFGAKYAVLIGVNNYDNEGNQKRSEEEKRPFYKLQNLSYACADAIDLKKTLEKNGFTVSLLTDNEGEKPTKANINRALIEIFSKLKHDDTVFVSFSGHGVQLPEIVGGEEKNYLCPSDAEIILNATTGKYNHFKLLSLEDDIEYKLKNIHCKKIVVLDACRNDPSRALDNSRSANLSVSSSSSDEFSRLKGFAPTQKKVDGMFQLFSCDASEISQENPKLGHGVYSHAMIEGLTGAADKKDNGGDGDGGITLAELFEYVGWRLKTNNQTPIMRTEGTVPANKVVLAKCEPERNFNQNFNNNSPSDLGQGSQNGNTTVQNTNTGNRGGINASDYSRQGSQNGNSGNGNNNGRGKRGGGGNSIGMR